MPEETTFTRRLNGPVLILMIVAALGVLAVAWSVIGSSSVTTIGVVVLVAAAALALGLLALRVKLTVRPDGVTVSMLGNSETIPASSIIGVGRGPVTGIKEGAGVRFVGETGRDTGYLVGGKPSASTRRRIPISCLPTPSRTSLRRSRRSLHVTDGGRPQDKDNRRQ